MKYTHADVRLTKLPRMVLVRGRKVSVDRTAIEFWSENPTGILVAVWNAEKRLFRLRKANE
ncbi:hypothetical protein SAMN05518861_13431 [Mesorhizobium sp. YR577]|nr:hypothetical protein SAMN05518861_13431 [Mesorhizobium sp. YR577]